MEAFLFIKDNPDFKIIGRSIAMRLPNNHNYTYIHHPIIRAMCDEHKLSKLSGSDP
jgi:hypothetical protein